MNGSSLFQVLLILFAPKMSAVENVLQQHVLQVASAVEEQLDAEIQQLDELDSDGIEKLREQRLKQMRNEAKARQEWLAKVSIEH